jgi:uncharacterized protein YjlB
MLDVSIAASYPARVPAKMGWLVEACGAGEQWDQDHQRTGHGEEVVMKEVRETEVREYRFEDNGAIPNNPTLPLLVYPQALSESDPSRCKDLLAENGWGGAWMDGVFPYHHYHSTSHEVLCVVGGSASITFGGLQGETIEVSAGDAVVIPAGVGHCNEGSDGGFSVIGAYPRGQENYDMRTGEEGERPEVLENIRNAALPQSDPLLGEEGPLLQRWAE